jgi:hypothetical protein
MLLKKQEQQTEAALMKFVTCSRLCKNVSNSTKIVAEELKIFDLSNIIFQYRSEKKYYVSQT